MSTEELGPWRITHMGPRRNSATANSDAASPAYESPECYEMRWRSAVCRDLRKGSAHVKSLHAKYLPRYENEEEEDYNQRVSMASFRNFYNKSANSLKGKVFAKPPVFREDVPPAIVADCVDADLNGNDWTQVAEDFFNNAIDEGISYLMVDYFSVDTEEELTVEQERELGLRPYWINIPQHRVLGVDYSKNGSVYTITMFRYWATERIRNGEFGHKYVNHIYVYEPNRIRVYRENDDEKENKKKWALVKDRPITLGMVPVTALNINATGPFEAYPPLEDLADMNIEHFQIRSDQRRALSVASFPLLAVFGAKLDNAPRIGPMQAYSFENEKANMKWVESQGTALRAGAEELKTLEESIRNFAMSFESPGMYATATAVNVDTTDAVAPIISWAFKLRDALAQVLYYHAQWRRLGSGGTVNVDTAFIKSLLTVEELKILVQAFSDGALTRVSFLRRLKEYGLFGHEFDPEDEAATLEDQDAVNAAREAELAAARPPVAPEDGADDDT